MTVKYKLVLAMLAGAAIGAAVNQALQAQGRPPAYFVFDNEVTDAEGYKKAVDLTPASLTPYGGRMLAAGGRTETMQGAPAHRVGIFAFGSTEDAKSWFNSARVKEILPIVEKTSKPRSFIVEGELFK
jgi:uncharacterized protein (DUF1330 family)